jgi:hypothetical protein
MKPQKLLCLVFALMFITAGFKSEVKKVNESNKPLLRAAANGTTEQFKLPLSKGGDVNAENEGVDEFQTRFLTFCNLAAAEFNKEITRFADRDNADPATHHMPFFEDAHAVRALAVAYDMTGEQKYLDACRRWSENPRGGLLHEPLSGPGRGPGPVECC